LFFEAGSPCKAQAGLKPSMVPPQPPASLKCSVTGVVQQRANSRNSSLSGLASCSNVPNKEPKSGRGQREIYYTTLTHHFQHTDLRFTFKYMKDWGRGWEGCVIIRQSFSEVWSGGQSCGPVLISSGLVRTRQSLMPVGSFNSCHRYCQSVLFFLDFKGDCSEQR
jgi:hypothetical protein